jgi:glycosyltransferase involved in cell wall biosynthesis
VKIVFLDPSGELGGAETALLDLVAAIREARPAWSMAIITSADGPLLVRAARLGIPSRSLTFPKSLARLGEWGSGRSLAGRTRLGASICVAAIPTFRYASRLRRNLATLAPDVVHTNGLKMHLLAARTCPHGASLLWHMHDYPDTRPTSAALLAVQAHHCAAVVANSESVAKRTRRLFGSAIPVHTLHNSVDLARFQPDGPRLDLDALAGLHPLAAGGLRVGLIGTFARWKGHDVFLDALAQVQNGGHVRGYVIGAPIYETAASQFSLHELRDFAVARGLGDKVGFTGHIDDVPSALRALDVVVHASVEPEPFGLVIAEAMACGRPVVVSRAGGAAEIAEAGALFHSPGDAGQLAQCLSQLICDSGLRASLGAAGRQAAIRLFNRQRLTDTLIPIYESISMKAHRC